MHGLVRISPSNRGLIWQTGFNAILNAGMDPEVKIIYWMDLKQATHFVCCIQTSYLHFSTENVQFKGNYRNQISIAWNWKWTECWYQLGSLRKYAKWCIKPKIEYQMLKFYANMVDDNYDLTNFIRFWFQLEIPRIGVPDSKSLYKKSIFESLSKLFTTGISYIFLDSIKMLSLKSINRINYVLEGYWFWCK